jgi:hypothetical protein
MNLQTGRRLAASTPARRTSCITVRPIAARKRWVEPLTTTGRGSGNGVQREPTLGLVARHRGQRPCRGLWSDSQHVEVSNRSAESHDREHGRRLDAEASRGLT